MKDLGRQIEELNTGLQAESAAAERRRIASEVAEQEAIEQRQQIAAELRGPALVHIKEQMVIAAAKLPEIGIAPTHRFVVGRELFEAKPTTDIIQSAMLSRRQDKVVESVQDTFENFWLLKAQQTVSFGDEVETSGPWHTTRSYRPKQTDLVALLLAGDGGLRKIQSRSGGLDGNEPIAVNTTNEHSFDANHYVVNEASDLDIAPDDKLVAGLPPERQPAFLELETSILDIVRSASR